MAGRGTLFDARRRGFDRRAPRPLECNGGRWFALQREYALPAAKPHRIGIRLEEKSRWERRAPLTPEDVAHLAREAGLSFQVQRSPIRIFPEAAYRAAGAEVVDDLRACPVIMGIKEIPVGVLEPRKTYVFFSHTIKRQPHNMPMLRRIVELGCTLIDYERIVDERGRRLVFFGRHAGLAGFIDAMWALGQRLRCEGIASPFETVRRAYDYRDSDDAKRALAEVGERIRRDGLPETLRPMTIGFAGYGHVSMGAQEMAEALPLREVGPDQLAALPPAGDLVYKVVFREEHMVERMDAGGRGVPGFDLQEYYDHPDRYHGKFFPHVPHLSVLVNGIYWDARYPRLITRKQLRELYAAGDGRRLRVIADISCDVEGSIECTVRATDPGDPVYVYEPLTGHAPTGVAGDGPVILAVDILPCELPVDASRYFGQMLRPLVPALARADFSRELGDCGLPPELQRATIVYNGELTEPYRYLDPEVRGAH